MDKLSRLIRELLEEEDEDETEKGPEECDDTKDQEEDLEVIYEKEKVEVVYEDYKEICPRTEVTENQYHKEKEETRRIQPSAGISHSEGREIDDPKKSFTNYGGGEEEAKTGLLKIEYNEPVLFNDQFTYGSIFIENNETNKTVYELTLEVSEKYGMDVKMSYDEEMGTFYLDSMDGKEDGAQIDGNKVYLEFWVMDGETKEYKIGEKSIDQAVVKKGDRVEWRFATERESGCGGGGYERFSEKTSEILLHYGHEDPIKMYIPDVEKVLERNPFFYMDVV